MCTVMEGEEPTSSAILDSKNLLFIFLLDRSGSMNGPRMAKANAALQLFLRSLPLGSKFAVVSFGTDYEFLELYPDRNHGLIYDSNEANAKEAILRVGMFHANFGGTDIAAPLLSAISYSINMKKKVFLLTDGKVDNPREVAELARNEGCSVHTVGIGDGCDE